MAPQSGLPFSEGSKYYWLLVRKNPKLSIRKPAILSGVLRPGQADNIRVKLAGWARI